MGENTAMPHTVPTYLVAGAARSGSTSVAESLRSHPDAFMTTPKEPHYFALAGPRPSFTGPGDDVTINTVSVTDRDAYLALYPEEHSYVALGDASVSTLYYHEDALPRVLQMNPDIKVAVVLREPVSRAFSAYQYLRARGLEPVEDFLEAVALEPERTQLGWHHLWHYTAMSQYSVAAAAFRTALGDRFGVWFYDDLQAEPDRVFAEIQTFVGLDPERAPTTAQQRVNVSGQPRRPGLQKAIHVAASSDRTRRAVKAVVPFRVREAIRSANLRSVDVSTESNEILRPRFHDDLVSLQEVLDRPLPPGWLTG